MEDGGIRQFSIEERIADGHFNTPTPQSRLEGKKKGGAGAQKFLMGQVKKLESFLVSWPLSPLTKLTFPKAFREENSEEKVAIIKSWRLNGR